MSHSKQAGQPSRQQAALRPSNKKPSWYERCRILDGTTLKLIALYALSLLLK